MTGTDPTHHEDDAVIRALLVDVPFDGWTTRALRRALLANGRDPADAVLLFPGGAPEMIEAWSELADRDMVAAARAADLAAYRTPARVRAIVSLRLEHNRPHREALRRALAVLAVPGHARLAARITARTVDAIWHAAGDRSADFSWYTKRALLAGVYTSTLLFWLRDTSDDDAETIAFLDRRLADVARIGKARKRIEAVIPKFGGASA
ncbi:COQ9 family protein [Acidiphilium sp. AL]|uniref:COQ9 family protein n=1 Tax=Acidiphilium iwatense TaxID=768198 RepID=A0ABS9DVB0_9PROT|nr:MULTISPECIES: COQ9 family protein [Acidiphilium]MCF3945700.1 COQ9 family protein [Acidiphilium iwatense]MCU4159280.1 COQ9 family protein [Acidiphilium sp. AL]